MNHKSTTKEEFWKNQISEWQDSGKNQSQYCRDNNISPATFYYWKKRLTEQGLPSFVKLPATFRETDHMELIIPGGIKLIFDFNVQIETITSLLGAICQSIGMK